ncbi:MAG: metal-dependent hydrolase [Chlamydiae bacterium]|nr:metal-dependent hydrolase [Chlamydiota bacterium]MBI3265729.1 metal-dependent hydrolase [Chlamydiota bacterium]
MPSPLGHALASAILHKKKVPGSWSGDWKRLLFHMFCGMSPDLDFLPGLFLGNISLYHHGFTHSILGAGLMGAFFWVVYGLWRRVWKVNDLFFLMGLVSLHPLMDVLALDTASPYGCPLGYPFSKVSVMSPYVFFQDIHRAGLRNFLFGKNNLLAFGIEAIFFLPLMMALSYREGRSRGAWFIAVLISFFVTATALRVVKWVDGRALFMSVWSQM